MHIVIEQYPLDEISIIVDPSDTISSLKERIMNEFLLSREKLKDCLLVVDFRDCLQGEPIPFLDNAKDLFEADDSTTLRDLGVKDGDNLRLGYREPFTIYAISSIVLGYGIKEGNKIEVNCYDTIQSLKDKIRRATRKPINRGNFPSILFTKSAKQRSLLSFGFYNIHPEEWKEHRLYLTPRNYMPPFIPMIREARKKKQRRVSSKSARKARVQHKEDQEEFDDDEVDSPNDFYVIRPGSRCPANRKVQIFVEIQNISFRLPIHANIDLNVAVLKNDIITCCKSYVEIDFPDYVMNGRFELFRNNCRLHNYDPFSIYTFGSKELLLQLYYDISFHIEVIFSEQQYKVYVRCSDTVARLKEKLHHVTGILKKYQRLYYNGCCLDNDERRLIYYGINELGDKSFRFPMCLHRVSHLEEEENKEVEENFTTTPEIEVPTDMMTLVVEKYTTGCQVQVIESITQPPLTIQVDGSSDHYHRKN